MKFSIGLLAFSLCFFSLKLSAQLSPDFLKEANDPWVDSVFNSLSVEEKIGQLLMPRANYSGKPYDIETLSMWVEKYHVGGLALFAGPPTRQAEVVNQMQALSKTPLLIGQDLEWGLNMRIDSAARFPYQMTLGAMQGGVELIEQMGAEIGRQCKRMGIHVNYAPVVDINNNPQNPVINFRSFGENKEDVANKGLAYMKGLQSEHIIATAKHFPGHGDTGVDSHFDLPVIKHDKKHLVENELYPFKRLIDNGLTGIMTAHLSIPALDKTPNLATTMSKKIVTDLLQKEMGFQGLTFTDAMDMQGAVKHFPNGTALVKAILAGNDILETFEDVPTAVKAIKDALDKGELKQDILDQRVRKILMAKKWVGLNHYQPVSTANLVDDLNTIAADFLNREMAEKSITLLKNTDNTLPIKDLQEKIAFVSIDRASNSAFQEMALNYTHVDFFNLPQGANDDLIQLIHNRTRDYDRVVIGLHLNSVRPYSNYGINISNQFSLAALLENKNSTVVIFGNPYALGKLDGLDKAKAIVMAYQLTDYQEEAATQAIFGALPFVGKLPVTVNELYPYGMGIMQESIDRLSYGIPEQEGLNSAILNARVDSVIQSGLQAEAYPGAVMEIAKNGRVIFQKAYGYHTYEDAQNGKDLDQKKTYQKGNTDVMDAKNPFKPDVSSQAIKTASNEDAAARKGMVKLTDLYDFASVTKVSTSALAVMQLMSEDKFDLDATWGTYNPAVRGTNKENLTFRDMLTHRSGLKAWIPFWRDCVDTMATINKALIMNPQLLTKFERFPAKKPNLWQQIFGKKEIPTINYIGSVENNPKLWEEILKPQTITWKPHIFAHDHSANYPIAVTDSLYIQKNYSDTIYHQILSSPVKPNQGYVYSDLHYYYYPKFMPALTGKPWDEYLYTTYKKLGANSLTYNPREKFNLNDIVPTEYDPLFRKTLIHGRVHDEGAGMLNGVSGHAGLFGTANDLIKLMQMYLQNGSYGGEQFIKPEVIAECTDYQFDPKENRRAIAFDKLHPDKSIANGPQEASDLSYGHSGYTGTFTWIDPQYATVYVFLSNRVYPTRENNKISTMNIRTEVGNEIFKTIKETLK